jgi:hypothetical protein
MPRPKAPPTPSASTDLVPSEQTNTAAMFDLPPPAMSHKSGPKLSPPVSPNNQTDTLPPPRKRTLSGSRKVKDDPPAMYDLPPPPSRARKIIQMKPKTRPTASAPHEIVLPSPNVQTPKPSSSTGTKRKQPSATSSAGKKAARKTAHSIIERRRRSKMNEEFGVLKDMIPACEGAEMHKLAILQAGIEYVRYLEDCIDQLKTGKDQTQSGPAQNDASVRASTPFDQVDESTSRDDFPSRSGSMHWQSRKTSIATTDSSSSASPALMPQTGRHIQQSTHRPILPNISSITSSPMCGPVSASATPTLLSPAFGAVHFSPDLARTGTNSTHTSISLVSASPNILPLPQAMMSLDRPKADTPTISEGGAEASATVALMMMSSADRRADGPVERSRSKGMSVRDLLTS